MALRIVRKMDELEREIGKIETMTHDITVFLNGLELLEDHEHSQARILIQEKIVNIQRLVKSLNELQHSLTIPPRSDPVHVPVREPVREIEQIVNEIKPIRILPTITRRSRR